MLVVQLNCCARASLDFCSVPTCLFWDGSRSLQLQYRLVFWKDVKGMQFIASWTCRAIRGVSLWFLYTLVLYSLAQPCCDCIAIVWIAMGLVGLYEQRKQFLCVWQLWVVQYQLQWMPLPLALVPCIPLSVFVSCSGQPQLVRGGFSPPFWRGVMALQSHKLYDSPIVTPPWSRLTFLPRLAVIWMLV